VLATEGLRVDGKLPVAFWVGVCLKLSLVLLFLVPILHADMEQYEAKGMSWRVVIFPLTALIIPTMWRLTGSRAPYPYLADNLAVIPPLTDVLWNTLDTFLARSSDIANLSRTPSATSGRTSWARRRVPRSPSSRRVRAIRSPSPIWRPRSQAPETAPYDRRMTDRLPRTLLHLEGLAVATAATILYFHLGYPWWLFVVLALAPDLSMLGYVAGPAVGATAYNVAHTYVLPVALALVGVLADGALAVQVGLIWITHIGVDRGIGYGLKYRTAFRDTHLQRV
jgi:hypothetical protein